ncbi:MAG: alpha-N-arabinofuranosidase [Steroidobacteraceae bacterium]
MTRGIGGRVVAALSIAGLLSAPAAPAQAEPPAATVSAVIHIDRPGAVIDRHLYGQFAEHLGRGIYEGIWVGEHSSIPNIRGIRTDVVAALRELHVPDVRWPGGCFADEYHWRDGIGPREKRPVRLNTNWGGVPEPNEFGTHEFLDFASLIGADAYINGNLGTGSAAEMAEWLQYLTSDKATALTAERARNGHPKPWKIAYFAVGNEAWGCGGNMTPEHYADLFNQVATFLKAPEGARPTIIASGGHDADTSWTQTLLTRIHQSMGAISFHYYTIPGDHWRAKGPATGFGENQWISTFAHTLEMQRFLDHNVALLDRLDPARHVALAVDEWGTWYDPMPGREPGFLYQQNTLRDALVAALNFNIFHAHAERVKMANIAQMVNVLQAMILTQGPRMLLTPTYHIFRMYGPFQDATSLASEVETYSYSFGGFSVPAVSLSAARAKSGEIVLAFVNVDPHRAVPIAATLAGDSALQHVSATVLTAPTMDARNTFEEPDAVHPAPLSGARLRGGALSLVLPAKSVVVVSLE